jgi:hypothetical protein
MLSVGRPGCLQELRSKLPSNVGAKAHAWHPTAGLERICPWDSSSVRALACPGSCVQDGLRAVLQRTRALTPIVPRPENATAQLHPLASASVFSPCHAASIASWCCINESMPRSQALRKRASLQQSSMHARSHLLGSGDEAKSWALHTKANRAVTAEHADVPVSRHFRWWRIHSPRGWPRWSPACGLDLERTWPKLLWHRAAYHAGHCAGSGKRCLPC